jgi:hypothetical protein
VRQYCGPGSPSIRGKRWGERLEQSLPWGRQERGSSDRDPRTANSERCFGVRLSRGEALCCAAMGGSAWTVRHAPVGVKSYTRRDHPVIYVDVPAPEVGNPADIPGVPPQSPAQGPFPLAPPPRQAGPTAAREEVIARQRHGNASLFVTEALARSERAAGRRTLPHPAARFTSAPRRLLLPAPGLPVPGCPGSTSPAPRFTGSRPRPPAMAAGGGQLLPPGPPCPAARAAATAAGRPGPAPTGGPSPQGRPRPARP